MKLVKSTLSKWRKSQKEEVFEDEDVELYCKWKAAGADPKKISSYLGEKKIA